MCRVRAGSAGRVIGSNDFRNDIIVRGGSPLENLFVVERRDSQHRRARELRVGRRHVSLLDAELIHGATSLTGCYPAPYINHRWSRCR